MPLIQSPEKSQGVCVHPEGENCIFCLLQRHHSGQTFSSVFVEEYAIPVMFMLF